MNKFLIANKIGVTKKAIKKATNGGIEEKDLLDFIHGDIDKLYKSLPHPSGAQSWESSGKRYVQLEEARFVARHILRNNIKLPSSALVLSGTDPALACLPWAMCGIATKFVAYEKDILIYSNARHRVKKELQKIQSRSQSYKECELEIVYGDILEEKEKFGIIDLDFCSNQLRTKDSRGQIIKFLDHVTPSQEPFVLRTTLHIGRANNSSRDIEGHIEEFEKELRRPLEGYYNYKIRACDRSPYQSSVPMVSLVWILERQDNTITQKEKSSENTSIT
jgi:hypothetical protein